MMKEMAYIPCLTHSAVSTCDSRGEGEKVIELFYERFTMILGRLKRQKRLKCFHESFCVTLSTSEILNWGKAFPSYTSIPHHSVLLCHFEGWQFCGQLPPGEILGPLSVYAGIAVCETSIWVGTASMENITGEKEYLVTWRKNWDFK